MRAIKDNLYIFSTAKSQFGEVIAERSRYGGEAVGKNIFEYLKMVDSEIKFFTSGFDSRTKNIVCAVCEKKESRVVLFFGFLSKAASICLAVVLDIPYCSVSRAILNSYLDSLLVSGGVVEAAEKLDATAYPNDKEVTMYLSGIFGQIMELSRLKLGYFYEPTENIRSASVAIADFVGVDMDFYTYVKANEVYGDCKEVFDGRICAASLLMFSLMARSYSVDRCLRIEVIRGISGCFIELSFEIYSDGWQEPINYLAEVTKSTRNIPIFLEKNEDWVKMSVVPYYEDVGFVGVKRNNTYFDIVEYEELI